MENKPQRFMNLEGLRGVAALVVVFYHLLIIFYPGLAYGSAPVQNMRFEDNLYGSPLNVFLSGGFAVGIFFIISGFVLSIGFFQTSKTSIIKKLATKRYLRLMIPALVSVLLSFTILALNLDGFRDATTAITHVNTLNLWNFTPNVFSALQQGLYGAFFQSQSFYNPVLWTMTYEFIGSFVVFLFLFMFGESKYRWLVYGVLVVATFNSWYFGFILGMILADIHASGIVIFKEKYRKFAILTLFVGLFMGGYPFGNVHGTIYEYLYMPWLTGLENNAFYISMGAALVVLSVMSLPRLSNFFASPRISRLGKYTYSLYLTHYLVYISVGTTLFVFFSHWLGLNKAVLVSFAFTIPVIIGITLLFERYVDRPAIKVANYFSDLVSGKRTVDFKGTATQQIAVVKGWMGRSRSLEVDEEI